MARDVSEVVADLDGLAPIDPEGLDLDRLQALADEYFSLPGAADHLDVWFRLYERYPEYDGHGLFWTISHGIEDQPRSDRYAVASVRRKPSRFPVLMINRMLNGGITKVGRSDLLALLRSVAADTTCLPSVREDAQGFLEHQAKRKSSDPS